MARGKHELCLQECTCVLNYMVLPHFVEMSSHALLLHNYVFLHSSFSLFPSSPISVVRKWMLFWKAI